MTLTLNFTVTHQFLTLAALGAWGAGACYLSFRAGQKSTVEESPYAKIEPRRIWQGFLGSMVFFWMVLSGLFRILGV